MKSAKTISSAIFLIFPSLLWCQTGGGSTSFWHGAYDNIFFILAGIVILGVVFLAWNLVGTMSEYHRNEHLTAHGMPIPEETVDEGPTFFEKAMTYLSGFMPREKEADLDLGHEYDGIRELDNRLPPWWLYLFYFTIAWAVVYIYVSHFAEGRIDQATEYALAMEEAEEQKLAYLERQANAIDETSVTLLTGVGDLAGGKKIYDMNCLSCHGPEGQGGVGPNFTDKYWIHGGDIKDLFATIKYGVPEKGMISWQSQLPPSAMQQVASYILSMQGTNPPNPKDPEGVLYEPSADGQTALNADDKEG